MTSKETVLGHFRILRKTREPLFKNWTSRPAEATVGYLHLRITRLQKLRVEKMAATTVDRADVHFPINAVPSKSVANIFAKCNRIAVATNSNVISALPAANFMNKIPISRSTNGRRSSRHTEEITLHVERMKARKNGVGEISRKKGWITFYRVEIFFSPRFKRLFPVIFSLRYFCNN